MMFAVSCLVTCLSAVDAFGLAESTLLRKRKRFQASPLSRLLLASPVVKSRATSRSWTRFLDEKAKRRRKVIASAIDDDSRAEPHFVEWIGIDEYQKPNDNQTTRTMPLLVLDDRTVDEFVDEYYVPHSKVVLPIAPNWALDHVAHMCDDIARTGNRCIAACAMETGSKRNGRLMQTAVLFNLTNRVGPPHAGKLIGAPVREDEWYFAEFSLVGRVKVLEVLNPHADESEGVYLVATVEDVIDIDEDVNTTAKEIELGQLFKEFVMLQDHLQEEIRFPLHQAIALTFDRSTDKTGLWGAIGLWKLFLKARVDRVVEGTTFDSYDEWKRFEHELHMSNSHPMNEQMLAMIQCTSHSERLSIFKRMLGKHVKRLQALKMLKSVFDSTPTKT